uniref:Peptidase S1 domain-containing protein n=1 Tax=Periophthalmus magnuspinnatus TaxID=409849 RepID=A0A3B4AWI4_9GOBI
MSSTQNSLCVAEGAVETRQPLASFILLKSLRHTEEETRIIGGEEALFHSWPWQVSLTFITMPACGGAILSPFWVLSAAHCFRRCNSIQVLVVVIFILNILSIYTQTKEYDIALLKLKEPLIFNDFVRPINIWMTTLPLFTECTTTGWGSTRENGPRVNKLQEVNVTLLPSEVCNKYYVGRILDTMFCAGKEEGGADACQGDSGGPISCFNGSRYELAGVVSWGVGCGRAKKPGVYTRIQNVISWITDVISKQHLATITIQLHTPGLTCCVYISVFTDEENILSVGTPAAGWFQKNFETYTDFRICLFFQQKTTVESIEAEVV